MRLQLRSWFGPAVCLAAGVGLTALLLQSSDAADEKGKITLEKIEYKGWKNNLRIANGSVELIITLDVGPRIISYRLNDGKNVFKEFAEELGHAGEKEWKSRGGHRFWVGPEDLTRTYALDNGPVQYKELAAETPGVRFFAAAETEYGIQKEIDVFLGINGSQVQVVHRIKNVGEKDTELAPWALSVMDAGGVEIIPLPAKKPHPGEPKNARSPKDFAPNLNVSIWPFFDFKDSRWTFGSKYITLRQDASKGPTKFGMAHQEGWVGYLNHGTLFIKRIEFQEDKTYPDRGCNFETFANEDMLEVETLGPLVTLGAGKSVEHVEHWDLAGNVKSFENEAGIDANVLPKIPKK